jgi:assimilatory nitrate reductase electron transfer subunit
MKVVIAGNGMAGARLAADLQSRDADVKVTVFGAEPERAYNRILLSQVLAGKVTESDVELVEPADRGLDVRPGNPVTAINRTAHTVTVALSGAGAPRLRPAPAPGRGAGAEATDLASGGEEVRYDHLVLATGSRPVIPPLSGLDPHRLPDRVAVFRTLADCRRIATMADGAGTALVLGGGLLGLEAARGLAGRGIRVQLVHPVGHLMERQLDAGAGAVLADTLTRLGIATHLGVAGTAVTIDDEGVTLTLDDGRTLTADLLVISCGVRPETGLATGAGLAVRRGIVVDDRLRTSDPDISAIGDCAEFEDAVSGLVAPAWEQARVLAATLTGDRHARYRPPPVVTRLKADGIDLAAMGTPDAGTEHLTFTDPVRGTYARLAIDTGRLTGAILLGDNPAVGTVIQLFDRAAPVPIDRRSLLLGRSSGGTATAATESPALIPDAATICQCNTVSKGQLVACWRDGAHTLPDIVAACRATTGCGTCRDAVEGIVDWLSRTDPVEVTS